MQKITLMPFNLSGKIFRSVMPYGVYDQQGTVLESYLQQEISAVMILSEKKEWPLISGKMLNEVYLENKFDVFYFPIADFSVPGFSGFKEALETVIRTARNGRNVAVHCLAGIGRTGLFMAFLAQEILGISPVEAIHWVRESLPGAIETEEQIEFIKTKSGLILSK